VKPDESRVAYDGRLIDVTVERWGDREREIVEHPGAVAIVAVDAEGRVTLVRQLREAARARLLELPAGTLEDGEEPLATAQRELAEETGLRGGEWREVRTFYMTPGFCRERMTLFVAENLDRGEPSLIHRPAPQELHQLQERAVIEGGIGPARRLHDGTHRRHACAKKREVTLQIPLLRHRPCGIAGLVKAAVDVTGHGACWGLVAHHCPAYQTR
jgi:8-oxo-dGTP pyrophosphatase MutT (NUDIX family)